jgi:hypothetical protein
VNFYDFKDFRVLHAVWAHLRNAGRRFSEIALSTKLWCPLGEIREINRNTSPTQKQEGFRFQFSEGGCLALARRYYSKGHAPNCEIGDCSLTQHPCIGMEQIPFFRH